VLDEHQRVRRRYIIFIFAEQYYPRVDTPR
jgi:hypothetical protein